MKCILKAGILLCIPILLLSALIGCTEVYDPSSVLYPTEAGLEKTADGYLVTVRIGEELYHAAGPSFREAADLLDLESGGKIFWKTVRIWLLSDQLSRDELLPFPSCFPPKSGRGSLPTWSKTGPPHKNFSF